MRKVNFFFKIISWILCIYSSLYLCGFSMNPTTKYIRNAFILFISFVFSICFAIALNYFKRTDFRKNIIDYIIILLCFFYFLSFLNIDYGYGNTLGILGYKYVFGLFCYLNIPYKCGEFILCISSALICICFAYKFKLLNRMNEKLKKKINLKKIFYNIFLSMAVVIIFYAIISIIFKINKIKAICSLSFLICWFLYFIYYISSLFNRQSK